MFKVPTWSMTCFFYKLGLNILVGEISPGLLHYLGCDAAALGSELTETVGERGNVGGDVAEVVGVERQGALRHLQRVLKDRSQGLLPNTTYKKRHDGSKGKT